MKTFKILITITILQLNFTAFCQINWTNSNSGLPINFAVNDFETVNSNIYAAGSYYNGTNFEARIYKSTDSGLNWIQINTTGLLGLYTGNSITYYNNKFFISGSVSNTSQNYSVFVSTNNGQNWTISNSGLPNNIAINDFENVGTDIYAIGSFYNGLNFEAKLYKSSNDGLNWTQINTTGLTTLFTGNAIVNFDNKLFVSGSTSNSSQNYSVFMSSNNGQSWTLSNSGLPANFAINSFENVGTNLYAGGSFYNGANFEARLYKSNDNGLNWTQIITTGLSTLFTGNALINYDNKLFISGSISNSLQNYSVFVSNLTLSTVETNLKQSYKLYPNPFQKGIYIENINSDNLKFEIYDISGKILKINEINKSTNIQYVNLMELNKGIYILKLKSENEDIKPIKIIKE